MVLTISQTLSPVAGESRQRRAGLPASVFNAYLRSRHLP
jgi:hypothetical protein